jgi:hypothetical protein
VLAQLQALVLARVQLQALARARVPVRQQAQARKLQASRALGPPMLLIQ